MSGMREELIMDEKKKLKTHRIIKELLDPMINIFCIRNEKEPRYLHQEQARYYLDRKLHLQRLLDDQ
jgi:hypothetical protein